METFLYLITYNIKDPNSKRYKNLKQEIELNFKNNYIEINNLFIVKTSHSAAQIHDDLLHCFNDGDNLVILRLAIGVNHNDSWAGLSTKDSTWLFEALQTI